MNYEIHITLNKFSNTDKFVDDCYKIGVKPIIIRTERDNNIGHQVMTSSKHTGDSYEETLSNLVNLLVENNYSILRKKVEIQPMEQKHNTHIYYESHLRLKVDKDYDFSEVRKLCAKHNFHFSKNLFKTDKDFIYQMITYRGYNMEFEDFKQVISGMKSKIDGLNINCDKVEIEECVYDSNINVDSNWLY